MLTKCSRVVCRTWKCGEGASMSSSHQDKAAEPRALEMGQTGNRDRTYWSDQSPAGTASLSNSSSHRRDHVLRSQCNEIKSAQSVRLERWLSSEELGRPSRRPGFDSLHPHGSSQLSCNSRFRRSNTLTQTHMQEKHHCT